MKISTSTSLTPSDGNALAENQTYCQKTRSALFMPWILGLLVLMAVGANAQSIVEYWVSTYQNGNYAGYDFN